VSSLLTIIHVIICVFLVLTILLQSGKSGGMGAAFGGGNAATVFGGSGASSFLRKLTAAAATGFMLISMTLAFLASHNSADSLEKFGESQQKLADDKEKQRDKALEDAKKGSAAGSGSSAGSAMVPAPPMAGSSSNMMTPGTTTPDIEAPDTTPTGSAAKPATRGLDLPTAPTTPPAPPAGAPPAPAASAPAAATPPAKK
jgi:preprotein translocase subunit SecG